MEKIDLHVHSNISDGSFTPTELVKEARKKHLRAFALTDHDTILGLKEAKEAVKVENEDGYPLELIKGVEISSACNGKDIHILGLFIDDSNAYLQKELQRAVAERDERNMKMIHKFNKAGIPITLEALKEGEPDAVITRAHFAKYLTAHGYTKSNKEAFCKYLGSDGPFYVPREFITPVKAIELIKQAKGLAILAHPLLYKYSRSNLEQLVSFLTSHGLDGIEAIYSSNIGNDEAEVSRIARLNNLLISGGSDFHGTNKPDLSLGSGRGNLNIPYELIEKMKERLLP